MPLVGRLTRSYVTTTFARIRKVGARRDARVSRDGG
jgi:hypothetical protein